MGGETCRILLVDDDEDDYLLTKDWLGNGNHYHYILDWASDYATAQEKLSSGDYQAVLVDYNLDHDHVGTDLIRDCISRACPTPFILFTGHDSYDADLAALQAGATMYLSKKEATPLLLDRIIRYAIERKKTENLLQQETLQRRIVEEQLRQEREILRSMVAEQKQDRRLIAEILDSISDGFFALDRSWRFTYVNYRATQNLGYSPQELIGQNLWTCFPNVIGTPLEDAYRQAMDGRQTVRTEMSGLITGRWLEISIYPSAGGISVYWLDKTDQKRLEQAMIESEAHHRLILDTIYSGYALCEVITDPQETPVDFRIIDANPSLGKWLKLKTEALLGKTILECVPELEPSWILTLGQVALTGEPARFHYLVGELNKVFEVTVVRPRPNHIAVLFIESSIAQAS